MRAGIYLGRPIGRVRRLGWLLFGLGCLATLAHLSGYLRERNELVALRERIEQDESLRGRVSSDRLGDDAAGVLQGLRTASASGVAAVVPPTEMLQLIGNAVPDRVALIQVSFEPSSSPPSLLIEAVAQSESDITALQKRVTDSPRVRSTQLLGERTAVDGTVSVRLQVDLAPGQ